MRQLVLSETISPINHRPMSARRGVGEITIKASMKPKDSERRHGCTAYKCEVSGRLIYLTCHFIIDLRRDERKKGVRSLSECGGVDSWPGPCGHWTWAHAISKTRVRPGSLGSRGGPGLVPSKPSTLESPALEGFAMRRRVGFQWLRPAGVALRALPTRRWS